MIRLRILLVLVAAFGCQYPSVVRGDIVIVPPRNVDSTGGFQSPGPLRFFGTGGSRNQQVYDASLFSSNSPILISAVSFRPFANFGSSFFGNTVTVSDSLITLSTTSRGGEGANPLSTRFADNIGADVMTVFRGALSLTTMFTPGPGNTLAFDYTIRFQTPFWYDPSRGNLLLDVLIPTNATVGGNGIFGFVTFDTVNQLNDGIFGVVSNSNGGATTGVLSTAGPVTQFTFTAAPQLAANAVPAPAGIALFSLGFAWLSVCLRKQRKILRDE